MTNLKLLIRERLGISNLLDEKYQKGGLDLKGLTKSQKIIEKVSIGGSLSYEKDKPVQKGEYKDYNIQMQGTSITWDAVKDKGKEIEFSEDELKMLKEMVEEKSSKKELKLSDTYLTILAGKLGITLE